MSGTGACAFTQRRARQRLEALQKLCSRGNMAGGPSPLQLPTRSQQQQQYLERARPVPALIPGFQHPGSGFPTPGRGCSAVCEVLPSSACPGETVLLRCAVLCCACVSQCLPVCVLSIGLLPGKDCLASTPEARHDLIFPLASCVTFLAWHGKYCDCELLPTMMSCCFPWSHKCFKAGLA